MKPFSSRNHLLLLIVFTFFIRKSCPSRDARTQLASVCLLFVLLFLTKTFFFRCWKIPFLESDPATTCAWLGFARAARYTPVPLKVKHSRAGNVIFQAQLPALCTGILPRKLNKRKLILQGITVKIIRRGLKWSVLQNNPKLFNHVFTKHFLLMFKTSWAYSFHRHRRGPLGPVLGCSKALYGDGSSLPPAKSCERCSEGGHFLRKRDQLLLKFSEASFCCGGHLIWNVSVFIIKFWQN